MKNKGIIFFLIFLAIVIVAVVIIDYNSTKRGELPPNPYEITIDPFAQVDTALILFNESRDYALSFSEPTGVCFNEGRIFVVGDQKMQIIEPNGKLFNEISFDQKPVCVYASPQNIFVGFRKSVSLLNHDGKKIADWINFSDSTVITSIAESLGTVS